MSGHRLPHGPAARAGRTRRVVTIIAVAAATTVAVSLVIAGTIGSATGCGSVDPTDPANYSTATIINDTADSVDIGDCHGSYCGPRPSATIAPNDHAVLNGACGATGKQMTTWKLSHTDGRLIGYIDIDTPHSTRKLTFTVTNASPDRLTPTKPR